MRVQNALGGLIYVFGGVLLFVARFQMESTAGFWNFMIGWAVCWAAVVAIWDGVEKLIKALKD